MDYIALLEAAVRRQFRLHPGLNPDEYVITTSMRDAPDKWRARAYEDQYFNDESQNTKKGEMLKVGYVMISLTDDTIIPISRADEHHKGYDHLHTLANNAAKKGYPLNPRDYLPIWTYGSNYIYSPSEIPDLLVALRKYLAYGGRDGPLQGSYEMKNVLLNSSDFVAAKGKVEVSPEHLAPGGQRLIDGFIAVAEAIRVAQNSPSAALTGKAFRTAITFLKNTRPILPYLAIDDYAILTDPSIVGDLQRQKDLAGLEKILFGFHGFKNSIHNAIRAYLERQKEGKTDAWVDDKIVSLWGNPEMAMDKLGSI